MAKRILMVITPARAGDLVSAARSAAAVARESGGGVRMAWMRPLPAPRVDRYDRLVADTDREMARLTAAALEHMAALAWEFGEVEQVVRFGRLATELAIEAHAWGADLICLAAPERPGPRHRFRLAPGTRGIGAGRATADRPAGRGTPSPRVDGPACVSLTPGTW